MAVASSIIAAAIIAGASTTATVYAAKKQGEAQEKATDAQTEAGHEALDFQKDQLRKREEQLAPYIQAGQQSLQGLSRFMGLPGPTTPTAPTRPTPTLVQPGGGP